MKRPEELELFSDILKQARRAVAAVVGRSRADLDSDHVLAAALERFVEVMGEAANKIPDAIRQDVPGIPWRELIGMRNRLIHGYSSVDHDVVWEVVIGDLPSIILAVERFLEGQHPE
jgi:uncharacterized protein with HEPN domain